MLYPRTIHYLFENHIYYPMDLNLKGRNALVCGSSQGLGRAAALEIALLGAHVTLVARSEDLLAEVAAELDRNKGQRHDTFTADFDKPEELKKKVAPLLEEKTYHILINNSGGPPPGPIVEAEGEAFIKALRRHLLCSHMLVKMLMPGMKAEGYGRIINIISTSVKVPIDNLGVSNTTRGAMANWSKTMANELAPFGITVNNVLPGMTDTGRLRSLIGNLAESAGISDSEMADKMMQGIPAGRFGRPREIGAAIAFLASPAAAYITGTNLTVDGGRTGCL